VRIDCLAFRITGKPELSFAPKSDYDCGMEATVMKRKHLRRKRTTTKSVLRLPDLEHAKAAVLNSLTSPDAQRGYRHAIDEFLDW
jgi:hypothetical protein